jgi:hypothetical protein
MMSDKNQWMSTYDAVFFVSVGTIVIGFFGLVIKYCLKSKCENVRLCFGAIEIKRRVDLETAYEMHEIDVQSNDNHEEPNEESVHHPKVARQRKKAQLKSLEFSYPQKDLPGAQAYPNQREDLPTRSEGDSNSV